MPRYIDAEPMPSGYSWDQLTDKEQCAVLSFLLKRPTADVAEVKHGKWIACRNNSGYKCSECKVRVKRRDALTGRHKYCYACGALMDLGIEELPKLNPELCRPKKGEYEMIGWVKGDDGHFHKCSFKCVGDTSSEKNKESRKG